MTIWLMGESLNSVAFYSVDHEKITAKLLYLAVT